MSEALWLRLSNMRYLTPGDFHAVRAKYDPLFTKPEEITHELLVQALSHEMSLKMDSKEQTLDIVID